MTADDTRGDASEAECNLLITPDDDDRLEDCINARRRAAALHQLRGYQQDLIPDVGDVDIRDLAHVLMAEEAGVPCEEVYDHNVEWMEAELVNDHLPALEELGLIEFDPAEGTITVVPALKMFYVVMQGSDLGALKNSLTRLPAGQLGWVCGSEYEERTLEGKEHPGDQETSDE